MMKTEKNKSQRVLESIEGSQRAKPKPELWEKIEEQIETSEAKVISIQQWRIVAAAAVLLLSLNLFALYAYAKNAALNSTITAMDTTTTLLISDYQIYEE